MIVSCDFCGKEFAKHPNEIRSTNHNFCSRSCAGKLNNVLVPKRKSKGRCKNCSKPIRNQWVYCEECRHLGLNRTRKPFEELKANEAIKNRLYEERGMYCEKCKISDWLGQKITLELHHIDGNNNNNSRENLELLCPNCHSITDNFRNKKRK